MLYIHKHTFISVASRKQKGYGTQEKIQHHDQRLWLQGKLSVKFFMKMKQKPQYGYLLVV